MTDLPTNLTNRAWLLDRLMAEVIGPDPSGSPVDIGSGTELSWPDSDSFWDPKRQANGEELLWKDGPVSRYGAGVLFPAQTTEDTQLGAESETATDVQIDNDVADDGTDKVDEGIRKKANRNYDADGGDEEVSLTNAYRPSAMGMSFLARTDDLAMVVRVEVGGFRKQPNGDVRTIPSGMYRGITVTVGDPDRADEQRKRKIWARTPVVSANGHLPHIDFPISRLVKERVVKESVPGYEGRLRLVVVTRPLAWEGYENCRLITVTLVNVAKNISHSLDEACLFQSGIRVCSTSGEPWIVPYPSNPPDSLSELPPEDEILITELMYRELQTFGIGHGCAADWKGEKPDSISEVWSETLPIFETSSTSADLLDDSGHPLKVSMRKLAGLDPNDDGYSELQRLIEAYSDWIDKLKERLGQASEIPGDLSATGKVLVSRCETCLDRLRFGLEFLQRDGDMAEHAREALRLANHAMLLAQLRASREVRRSKLGTGRQEWVPTLGSDPDPTKYHETKGYWRPFQIAFVLMTLPGICDPADDDRETVDLIWFPTGGGKTEAYLGLTAFTIFFNRLENRVSGGVDVLMRYTLRLLTAQQFERAGLLFCAMEHLRLEEDRAEKLGSKEFSLGMWVGKAASPNTRKDAVTRLRLLTKNPENAENPFVLLKCPWCSSEFGPRKGGTKRGASSVLGYRKEYTASRSVTVRFRCEDESCEYNSRLLPIYVVDEDIYENPPSLLIGTVDKFAMLAWKPEVRSIFGITATGEHEDLPPSLIIQDELHLISGPLGSVAGAFETIIEELCTTLSGNWAIKPKIIASTATISRSDDQVRNLYGREGVALFPPSGLEAGESFFATVSREADGSLSPGRLYVGIMGSAYSSQQTAQARIFASLLQWPLLIDGGAPDEIDPWWTLLGFYNSLRELGGALTLMVSDVRDYLRVIINRHGVDYSKIRQLLYIEELTSRIRNDQIPLAIKKLEEKYDGKTFSAVEACLASNIIEVGVDIDRLSLMTVVGQPKTTSQYIQVTSRVGRSASAPGMVCVIFNPGKPRDRSHFEHFRTFHQRLYAEVEPTSVTPFSPPAVDRVLHAVIVAAARQLQSVSDAQSPRPFPLNQNDEFRSRIENLIMSRVDVVDPSEEAEVRRVLNRRLKEWQGWDPVEYGGFGVPSENAPLMHPAGSTAPPEWSGHSWPTMMSMRNVDAGCEAEITSAYNEVE